jgi:hypothetical protein
MAYTTIDDPGLYFNTVLYTSNSGSSPRTISGVGFQPDWVWVKNRDSSDYNHVAADSVRGLNNILQPDTKIAQLTNHAAGFISSANSDGFVITAGSSNLSNYDVGSNKQVAWNWKAGTSFSNDASATGVGSIDSTGSISTISGFSIVTYTGAENAGDTVAHGLGAVPSAMIIKKFSASSEQHWIVYHHKNTGSPQDVHLKLDDNAQTEDNNTIFNDTAPTSTVFSLGSGSQINASGASMVAYCFTDIQGYSKFGKYLGNNKSGTAGDLDGTFVFCGFKPAWLMVKRVANVNAAWHMWDNKRNGFNNRNFNIKADVSTPEDDGNFRVDFLSNGFKWRVNDSVVNANEEYIYFAFAESPQVNSKGVPNNAR